MAFMGIERLWQHRKQETNDVKTQESGTTAESVPQKIVDLDAEPYVPDGWSVIEHRKGGQFKWDATKVKLHLSKKQRGGGAIDGRKLREELKGRPVYNANLLDYLLENPHLIPEEWKGKDVFFWATVYGDSDGDPCVRHLDWHGDRWGWDSYGLGSGWSVHCPAAVPAS